MKPANHSQCWRRILKPIVVFLNITLVLDATFPLNSAPATVSDRILVKPLPGIAETDLHGLFQQHDAVEVDQISAINVRILKVPEAARDHVLEALQHHPNVEFAERDYIHE